MIFVKSRKDNSANLPAFRGQIATSVHGVVKISQRGSKGVLTSLPIGTLSGAEKSAADAACRMTKNAILP